MSDAVTNWIKATGSMPWGVQSAFKDALSLVAEGSVKMIYGADSYSGSPCLVNAVNQMIHSEAGASPTGFAPEVVGAFDSLNRELHAQVGAPYTDGNYVTPFAAEVLLQHFGAMAPKPVDEPIKPVSEIDKPYTEKSDEDLMSEWLAAQTKPAEIPCPVEGPSAEISDADLAEIESFLKK